MSMQSGKQQPEGGGALLDPVGSFPRYRDAEGLHGRLEDPPAPLRNFKPLRLSREKVPDVFGCGHDTEAA